MTKIHHATAKRAAANNITITEKDGEFVLTFEENRLVTDDVKDGVAQIIDWLNDGDEPDWAGDEDEEDGDEDEGKSVVKRHYKKAYRPFKQTCGDDISKLITAHLMVKDDETGETKIDAVKLKKFAKLNDAWVDSYSLLNVGMRRMNVANRIRAKVRRDDYKIVWN